ncbi:MAG TPA: hypothetical protein VNX21_08415 [Candidatus Thermoplasmatota archaeon]|nr:hypothetical protein [Candidatus Thermoplasmatota archaeon]
MHAKLVVAAGLVIAFAPAGALVAQATGSCLNPAFRLANLGNGFVDPSAPSDWWYHYAGPVSGESLPAAQYSITTNPPGSAYMEVRDAACRLLCVTFASCVAVTQDPAILTEPHHVGVFCACSGTTSYSLTAFP